MIYDRSPSHDENELVSVPKEKDRMYPSLAPQKDLK